MLKKTIRVIGGLCFIVYAILPLISLISMVFQYYTGSTIDSLTVLQIIEYFIVPLCAFLSTVLIGISMFFSKSRPRFITLLFGGGIWTLNSCLGIYTNLNRYIYLNSTGSFLDSKYELGFIIPIVSSVVCLAMGVMFLLICIKPKFGKRFAIIATILCVLDGGLEFSLLLTYETGWDLWCFLYLFIFLALIAGLMIMSFTITDNEYRNEVLHANKRISDDRNMLLCTNCGKSINNDAVFCKYCGTKVRFYDN